MSGSFSSSVDFAKGTEQITNFNMHVSGNSYEAQISNAKGSFYTHSGNHDIFGVDSLDGGTWKVGQKSALVEKTGNALGSIYGPNGEAIGGNWHIDPEAIGVFQGTR